MRSFVEMRIFLMIRSVVSMIYITNECFLGGNMIPKNNTYKHKQHKNKNQHKIKTNDHPKLSIAG